jgi:[ribosomal protein S18]-alanine N-acetyltransferase
MISASRNPQISILPARLDDLSAIMMLEQAGFPSAEQWSERSWRSELLGERRTILIARAQRPVGVISITTIGELGDLHRLVVEPRSRRQGIGTDLVRAGLESVRQLGVRAVILDVAYHNEAAIALYQQLGFEQLSARQNYYGPGQHALILKLYDLQTWPARLASMTEDL